MTRPALLWREVEDVLGVPGWSLHVGYTSSRESLEDGPSITIHAAQLETGHTTVHLSAADLPNVAELERIVAELVETEDRQTALDLAHPDRREYAYADHIGAMVHALSVL